MIAGHSGLQAVLADNVHEHAFAAADWHLMTLILQTSILSYVSSMTCDMSVCVSVDHEIQSFLACILLLTRENYAEA